MAQRPYSEFSNGLANGVLGFFGRGNYDLKNRGSDLPQSPINVSNLYSNRVSSSNALVGSNPISTASNILGTLWSIGNGIYNIYNQEKNRKEEKRRYEEQKEYQKYLNNLMMQREDNAVQRRMADLRKAGLNPLLAFDQSAGASSGSNFSGSFGATDVDNSVATGMADNIFQLANNSMMYRLEASKIMNDNVRVANDSYRAGLERIRTLDQLINSSKDREEKDALIKLRKQELKNLEHNFKIARRYGEPVGVSGSPTSKDGVVKMLLEAGDNAQTPTQKTRAKHKKEESKGEKIFKTISGEGPPNEKESLYQFYIDLKTGQRYRFGKLFEE